MQDIRPWHHIGRWLSYAAATTLAVAAGALGLAAPAAATTSNYLHADSLAWTDATHPGRSHVNEGGSDPLGAWDGAISRDYLSFDLSSLSGRAVHQAGFTTGESEAGDCATATTIEVVRTTAIKPGASWAHPPRVLERLGAVTHPDCPGQLTFDLLPAVRAALGRGETRLTVGLRVTASQERDPAAGRLLISYGGLNVSSNALPVLGPVTVGSTTACATDPAAPAPISGTQTTVFTPHPTDTDSDGTLGVRFAVWSVEHPEQRTEQIGFGHVTTSLSAAMSTSAYPDGTLLAFAGQAYDASDTSAWSAPCYAKLDRVAPAQAPAVSSVEYPADGQPHGGAGLPGTFRFDAQGDRQVVAYRWWTQSTGAWSTVPAPAAGEAATMTYTPAGDSPVTLQVQSLDAAGNTSPTAVYTFAVRDSRPTITLTARGLGWPGTLTLSSPLPETTSFGYRVDDGDEVRVPAVDGKASTELLVDHKSFTLTVRVYVGDQVAGTGTAQENVSDLPQAESDFFTAGPGTAGVEGGFTFRPGNADVVKYRYELDDDPVAEVAPGPDGSATIRWTPQEAGTLGLTVWTVDAAGVSSDEGRYSFRVIDGRPTISVANGQWPDAGAGQPIQVAFTTEAVTAAEIRYSVNDGPEQSAPVVDGLATAEITPQWGGGNTISARTRFTNGAESPEQAKTFTVFSGPQVSSADYPADKAAGGVGQAGRFTFRPGLPGVTSYTYNLSGQDAVTVPAESDGTATVLATPDQPGFSVLFVTSRSADGTVSDLQYYEFNVAG